MGRIEKDEASEKIPSKCLNYVGIGILISLMNAYPAAAAETRKHTRDEIAGVLGKTGLAGETDIRDTKTHEESSKKPRTAEQLKNGLKNFAWTTGTSDNEMYSNEFTLEFIDWLVTQRPDIGNILLDYDQKSSTFNEYFGMAETLLFIPKYKKPARVQHKLSPSSAKILETFLENKK